MIINVSGGGGASLNFKVVGGTAQPVSPSENMIWVNTDVDITGWIFSSTEPSDPYEGMVWICISTNSARQFNALKKNGIMIYPVFSKQYIDNEWTMKSPSIYQAEKWNVLNMTYFYKEGNTYGSLTGGYVSPAKYDVVEFESTYINMYGQNHSCTLTLRTANKIDVTNLTELYFTVLKYDGASGSAKVGLCSIDNFESTSEFVAETPVEVSATSVTYSVDVSAVTGSYYIAVAGVCTSTSGNNGYHISQIYAV